MFQTPSEKKLDEFAYKLSTDTRFDYHECNCGNIIYDKSDFSVCPACGKKMCPGCRNQHGKLDSMLCWKPGRLKFRRIPGTGMYNITDLDTGQETTGGCE